MRHYVNLLPLKVIVIFLLPVIFFGCTNEDDDEKTYEELLTDHNWHLSITRTLWGGNETVDLYDDTDYHEEACEQDDYWKFDVSDNTYIINLGTSKCEEDEEQIDDWGTWELDYSNQSSGLILLETNSDNPDNIIPDIIYEVIELTDDSMVLRFGGCEDNTNPDDDGMCVTMTFDLY